MRVFLLFLVLSCVGGIVLRKASQRVMAIYMLALCLLLTAAIYTGRI